MALVRAFIGCVIVGMVICGSKWFTSFFRTGRAWVSRYAGKMKNIVNLFTAVLNIVIVFMSFLFTNFFSHYGNCSCFYYCGKMRWCIVIVD